MFVTEETTLKDLGEKFESLAKRGIEIRIYCEYDRFTVTKGKTYYTASMHIRERIEMDNKYCFYYDKYYDSYIEAVQESLNVAEKILNEDYSFLKK